MAIAIKVENLSKQYRLGQIGTGSLAHDVNRWWHSIQGKEDPYLKIGETNDRTTIAGSKYVWSLKGINFEIQQGEAVGIIGRNGAGKSTLLKILSKVTAPTSGSVNMRGRIASLLEVGTGFHPELTGRENIFLNGAILGMRKKEITGKFDEIVQFSGVERYIDTPVKRYSSGMYVRLAFAVAAHLETDTLLVDEVLAVGDAEFQKKCLGKMREVSHSAGRTVLFVSHNMTSVQALCDRGLYLQKGMADGIESIQTVVNRYLFNSMDELDKSEYFPDASKIHYGQKGVVRVIKVEITNRENQLSNNFKTSEDIILNIEWENMAGIACSPNFQLSLPGGICAILASDAPIDFSGEKKKGRGMYKSEFIIPANWLNANNYYLSVALDSHSPRTCYESHMEILKINVWDPMNETSIARGMFTSVREDAVLWPALECSFTKVN
jgi:lipopolysaccharide transport system ATP-binding protein